MSELTMDKLVSLCKGLFPSKTPTDHAGKYRFSKNQSTKAGGSSKAVSQRALVWDKSDRVSNRIVM